MNGDIPSFTSFYLEQMASLARFLGVKFSLHVDKCEGVREARDILLDLCPTDILWMTDDDVLYDPHFLQQIGSHFDYFDDDVAWLAGTKGDLNNRRGYDNFNVKVNPEEDIVDGCSYNHFYEESELTELPRTHTIDTGCVLLDMEKVHGVCSFKLYSDSVNSGGEDTVFAMQCLKKGWHGRFCPNAVSYHLEKENARFNEFAARGEMVLRVAQLLQLDEETVDKLKHEFMPWLFNKGDK